MNLMRDFFEGFGLLKKKMMPIIQNLHMPLTTNTTVASLKSDEFILKFIKDTYGIDAVQLAKSLN